MTRWAAALSVSPTAHLLAGSRFLGGRGTCATPGATEPVGPERWASAPEKSCPHEGQRVAFVGGCSRAGAQATGRKGAPALVAGAASCPGPRRTADRCDLRTGAWVSTRP
jgi:hypothetical protein